MFYITCAEYPRPVKTEIILKYSQSDAEFEWNINLICSALTHSLTSERARDQVDPKQGSLVVRALSVSQLAFIAPWIQFDLGPRPRNAVFLTC